MSLSAVPFLTQPTEPLVPLMVDRYGWTPRVCRDRIKVLRQTVLKYKRDGLTQPSKEWLVTEYAWTTICGYLDGFDPEQWGNFRDYLVEQFDVDQPLELVDVIEELRVGREMQARANAEVVESMRNLTASVDNLTRRLGVVEQLFRLLPEEFDAALDERRKEGDKRGESARDVLEDVRDGLRLVAKTLTGG